MSYLLLLDCDRVLVRISALQPDCTRFDSRVSRRVLSLLGLSTNCAMTLMPDI